MRTENKSESTLQNFMTYGSGLGGAFVAAALQSFRGGMSFGFSFYTLLAAIVGFILFVLFWKLFFSEPKDKRRKILLGVVSAILIIGGLAGVLYPLRFVNNAELPNLLIGLSAAVLALTGTAFLLFACKRFLDADERRNEPPADRKF